MKSNGWMEGELKAILEALEQQWKFRGHDLQLVGA